MRFKSLSVIKA